MPTTKHAAAPGTRHKALCATACLVLCAWCAPLALEATTITGTIKDPAGNGITGVLQLELSAPGITGAELLLVQPRVRCQIANGQVSDPCSVRGNDTITDPADSYYCLRVLSPSGSVLMAGRAYRISGASVNLGTASQLAGKVCT